MMLLWIALAILFLLTFYFFYYHYYWPYYRMPKLIGLPGPEPEVLFGNFRHLAKAGMDAPKQFDEWYQKYGENYLLFMGIAPMIVTHDPEMIKDVTTRHFDSFVDRSPTEVNILKFLLHADKSLATYTGDNWRRLRRIVAPGLSGKKVKVLSPIIESSCKDLTKQIGKYADQDVSADVTKCFSAFSMGVMLSSMFGRLCNGTIDLADAVNAAFAKTYGHMYGQEMAFTLDSHLPFLTPLLQRLARQSSVAKQWEPVQSIAAQLINERKKPGAARSDVLQHMIDNEDQETTKNSTEMGDKMSMEEIVSTAVLIIFSGMGHNLTFLAYLLATHPKVQDKLVNEIESYFTSNPDATLFSAADSIEYAEMVLKETLRLYPAINTLNRYCVQTCTTTNGTLIPKGTYIHIPIYNMQRDPKFWPDPEKFDPERFGPNQESTYDSSTYLAFGNGPRMCPGKYYSHIKIKMALINILREYKFVKTADTVVPLEIDNCFQLTPLRNLKVKVVSV